MSFICRAHFLDPNPKPVKQHVVDADLKATGQKDDAVFVKKQHDSAQGWFAVMNMEYFMKAGVNVAAGTSAGGINETWLRLVKQVGELTPVCARALHNRAVFNIEIHLIDRSGQNDAANAGKIVYKMMFKTAIFQSIRVMTGDEAYGSLASTIANRSSPGAQATDTRELEVMEIVYQGADFEWVEPSKKGTIELRSA